MKLKILLLLLFIAFVKLIGAQEPYRSLVITESRQIDGDGNDSYIELTNMGDRGIDLSEIKFAIMNRKGEPIEDVWNDAWIQGSDFYFYLPESVTKILQPGESFVVTNAYDFNPRMHKMRIAGYENADRPKETGIYQYADFMIHQSEKNDIETELYPNVKDSVTTDKDSLFLEAYQKSMAKLNNPQAGFYIEDHFAEGDSAVIDQVGNRFEDNGKNDRIPDDVAGVTNATTTAILVRKNTVKEGNLDFDAARGVGLEDSEWLPLTIPEGADNWRDTWWTVGNHGDFVLDANTLEPKSDDISVDFAGKTITVPWGIRRLDDIMRHMKYKPGVAWVYHLNESVEDSLMRSAQTGDRLTVYVFGETLNKATFEIVVEEPTEDANIVIPVDHKDLVSIRDGGPITNNYQSGILNWPRVTNHDNGIDTISGGGYGLSFALRTDTLLKYLEKPSNAMWEFVFVDGNKRADLKNGDKLRVIAQNGDVKDYFIEIRSYLKSSNPNLASITWPDISIPEYYQEVEGWTGDTIPNFNPVATDYLVRLPYDNEGIPSLVAKTEDLNATIQVTRATTFDASVEDRTVTFEVTAEDDSVKKIYNVELVREKNPDNLQPYIADPFLSEIGFKINKNWYAEICNPGNQPLDLSNYMFCNYRSANPADAIRAYDESGDWINRYEKYVPGYKWVSYLDWQVNPGILELDLNINSIVQPGDVFLMAYSKNNKGEDWEIPSKLDIQFNDSVQGEDLSYLTNPWGEEVNTPAVPDNNTNTWYMFRILNDSVKQGLKPANDPNDFELIEAFGMADASKWFVGGEKVSGKTIYERKPEITKGNPILQASFGTNLDDSEWIITNDAPEVIEPTLGQHFFNPPTSYKSTVTSLLYKVSKGYSLRENIKGILNGTTSAEFINNIFKADSAQILTLKSSADGKELSLDAVLSLNDTLVVMSADSTNTTKYVLNVSNEGLSSNAVLTSNRYTIEVTSDPQSVGEGESVADHHMGTGTITGMEYGTMLSTVLNNIQVPEGAILTVIDGKGAYVPLTMLNFDTTYVSVTVNSNQYFEVVAENGATTILYQLLPQASEDDAFLTSDVYDVDQKNLLIEFVPGGTAVNGFLSNITVSPGASAMVVDKLGLERTEGSIVQDDKIVVTSADGTVQTVYYLSMLHTESITETTYLAYVTSKVYSVDQLALEISGASGSTELSNFYNRITSAMGATAIVIDSEGNEITSGDLDDGDMLKVVSADGKVEVMYTLALDLTSTDMTEVSGITLYPNPTSRALNVSGVEVGGRIQVYNAMGATIGEVDVTGSIETISLEDQPSGIYLIVVSNKNELLGRFKAVKK